MLVTGANGLLGQKILQLLAVETKDLVVGTGRGAQRYAPIKGQQYIAADITVAAEVAALFDQVQPDLVIHAAAMADVSLSEREQEACWQVNVQGTGHIVAFAERQGCYLEYISTDFVYKGDKDQYLEDDKAEPVNFYGKSKLAAEDLVRQSKIPWSIIRTSLVLGISKPMSRDNLLTFVRKSLRARKPIQVVNDQVRKPTLAEDLARGCVGVARHSLQGIFHIAGKEALSPYEMAVRMARYHGLDESLISPVDRYTFKEVAPRPLKTNLSTAKIRKYIAFEPCSFEELLRVTAVQLKELGD